MTGCQKLQMTAQSGGTGCFIAVPIGNSDSVRQRVKFLNGFNSSTATARRWLNGLHLFDGPCRYTGDVQQTHLPAISGHAITKQITVSSVRTVQQQAEDLFDSLYLTLRDVYMPTEARRCPLSSRHATIDKGSHGRRVL